MSKYKHQLPGLPPEHERIAWTYFVSRDSLDGALSASCSLWNEKPLRTRAGSRVVWSSVIGHLGEFRPAEVASWFRTYPETDLELVRIETRPSQKEFEEAKRQAR